MLFSNRLPAPAGTEIRQHWPSEHGHPIVLCLVTIIHKIVISAIMQIASFCLKTVSLSLYGSSKLCDYVLRGCLFMCMCNAALLQKTAAPLLSLFPISVLLFLALFMHLTPKAVASLACAATSSIIFRRLCFEAC